jgi:hypothetical protein
MLNPKCSFGVGMDWAKEMVLIIISRGKKKFLIRDMAVV